MASLWWVSATPSIVSLAPPVINPNGGVSLSPPTTRVVLSVNTRRRRRYLSVLARASRAEEEEEEEKPYRHPLDFAYDWERFKPAGRPNLYPKLAPFATPLIDWLPFDIAPDDEVDEDELEEEEQQEQQPDPNE